MPARCLRLMGKKLLVALSLEGKFAGEGCRRSMTTPTCSPRGRGHGVAAAQRRAPANVREPGQTSHFGTANPCRCWLGAEELRDGSGCVRAAAPIYRAPCLTEGCAERRSEAAISRLSSLQRVRRSQPEVRHKEAGAVRSFCGAMRETRRSSRSRARRPRPERNFAAPRARKIETPDRPALVARAKRRRSPATLPAAERH